MRSFLTTVAVVVSLGIATAAPAPISVDIKYRITQAPGVFRIRIAIEPQAENRWACLYVTPTTRTGDSISRCWTLNGEQEPKTFWQEVKNLPVGRYEANAAVIRREGHSSLSTSIRLTVMGIGYEPEPEL